MLNSQGVWIGFSALRLLFTCNARGSHMFGRDAKDAALFKAGIIAISLAGGSETQWEIPCTWRFS